MKQGWVSHLSLGFLCKVYSICSPESILQIIFVGSLFTFMFDCVFMLLTGMHTIAVCIEQIIFGKHLTFIGGQKIDKILILHMNRKSKVRGRSKYQGQFR